MAEKFLREKKGAQGGETHRKVTEKGAGNPRHAGDEDAGAADLGETDKMGGPRLVDSETTGIFLGGDASGGEGSHDAAFAKSFGGGEKAKTVGALSSSGVEGVEGDDVAFELRLVGDEFVAEELPVFGVELMEDSHHHHRFSEPSGMVAEDEPSPFVALGEF